MNRTPKPHHHIIILVACLSCIVSTCHHIRLHWGIYQPLFPEVILLLRQGERTSVFTLEKHLVILTWEGSGFQWMRLFQLLTTISIPYSRILEEKSWLCQRTFTFTFSFRDIMLKESNYVKSFFFSAVRNLYFLIWIIIILLCQSPEYIFGRPKKESMGKMGNSCLMRVYWVWGTFHSFHVTVILCGWHSYFHFMIEELET